MDKVRRKGILGLDTVGIVLLTLLAIGIIAIVSMVVLTPLLTSTESLSKLNGIVTNESGWVNGSGYTLDESTARNFALTSVTSVLNTSNGLLLIAGNYTTTSGVIYNATAVTWGDVKISYTYVYNRADVSNLVNNMSSAPLNFFSQVPTFFTLLAVVVLILMIAIVIVAVSRFGGGNEMKGNM